MTSACVALPATALTKSTGTVMRGIEGHEAKMSVYQLMFWNSIFLKKAKLNVFLTFFLQKSNTFRQLSPLDRRSLKPAFRQLDFVNKMSRLFEFHSWSQCSLFLFLDWQSKHSIFDYFWFFFSKISMSIFLADGSKFIHYVPNSLFINVKIAFRPKAQAVFTPFRKTLRFFEGWIEW